MRARKTDPVTSHEAALSVKDEPGYYRTILQILKTPMSDEQMIAHFNLLVLQGKCRPSSDSALRTRRARLVSEGFVVAVDHSKTRFGRRTIVWATKKVGK
jgi:hypothetical protein